MKLSPIRRVPEEASVEIITQGMHSRMRFNRIRVGVEFGSVWVGLEQHYVECISK